MNQEQLVRSLRSVGMECFVKYFDRFSNLDVEVADIVEVLVEDEGYREPACRTRISNARKIFQAEKSVDAFQLILNSSRASDFAKDRAEELLKQTKD